MKTVILCGGFGTRIRDVSEDIPKPMLPIGKLPIIWHIMKYYSFYNYKDFVLCLGYKGNNIKDFFLNYEAYTRDLTLKLGNQSEIIFHTKHDEMDWQVTLAETGTETMTGNRIFQIKKYIGDDENFFLTYGDGLSNINLNSLLEYHKSHGKILTMTGVRPPSRFGELLANEDGLITEFNEKPQAVDGRISGGFFVCNKKIFEYLDNNKSLVFENEPMKRLVKDEQLVLYKHNEFWQCMDTNRDWKLLNSLYEKRDAPWLIW